MMPSGWSPLARREESCREQAGAAGEKKELVSVRSHHHRGGGRRGEKVRWRGESTRRIGSQSNLWGRAGHTPMVNDASHPSRSPHEGGGGKGVQNPPPRRGQAAPEETPPALLLLLGPMGAARCFFLRLQLGSSLSSASCNAKLTWTLKCPAGRGEAGGAPSEPQRRSLPSPHLCLGRGVKLELQSSRRGRFLGVQRACGCCPG